MRQPDDQKNVSIDDMKFAVTHYLEEKKDPESGERLKTFEQFDSKKGQEKKEAIKHFLDFYLDSKTLSDPFVKEKNQTTPEKGGLTLELSVAIKFYELELDELENGKIRTPGISDRIKKSVGDNNHADPDD